eukprot:PhM_4_TR3073/c0_g1_i1/m.102619
MATRVSAASTSVLPRRRTRVVVTAHVARTTSAQISPEHVNAAPTASTATGTPQRRAARVCLATSGTTAHTAVRSASTTSFAADAANALPPKLLALPKVFVPPPVVSVAAQTTATVTSRLASSVAPTFNSSATLTAVPQTSSERSARSLARLLTLVARFTVTSRAPATAARVVQDCVSATRSTQDPRASSSVLAVSTVIAKLALRRPRASAASSGRELRAALLVPVGQPLRATATACALGVTRCHSRHAHAARATSARPVLSYVPPQRWCHPHAPGTAPVPQQPVALQCAPASNRIRTASGRGPPVRIATPRTLGRRARSAAQRPVATVVLGTHVPVSATTQRTSALVVSARAPEQTQQRTQRATATDGVTPAGVERERARAMTRITSPTSSRSGSERTVRCAAT